MSVGWRRWKSSFGRVLRWSKTHTNPQLLVCGTGFQVNKPPLLPELGYKVRYTPPLFRLAHFLVWMVITYRNWEYSYILTSIPYGVQTWNHTYSLCMELVRGILPVPND